MLWPKGDVIVHKFTDNFNDEAKIANFAYDYGRLKF